MKCLQQHAVQKDKYCSSFDNDDAFITAGTTFASNQAAKQLRHLHHALLTLHQPFLQHLQA